MKRISKVLVFLLMTVTFPLLCMPAEVNSTPFVRQYDILSNKWGALLWQKEYQTNDIHRNLKSWSWKPCSNF